MVIDETRITLSMREGYRQFRLTEVEIAEIKKRDQYFYWRYRYEPTGKLELSFDCRDAWQSHTWRDGRALLEDQLVEIASAFLQAPVEAKRKAERKRQEQKLAWEEQQRAWKVEEAQKNEPAAQQALLKEARAWQDWRSINVYLDALNEALGQGQTALSEVGQKWLSNAKKRAVVLNPLTARILDLANSESMENDDSRP